MKHRLANAKELPSSTRSEFERVDPDDSVSSRRKAHHKDRSGYVLSDNPRWIAGTEQAEAKHEVATTIRAKSPDGVWMYHRRIVNGHTESTVDILAVTSTGVWVIEVEEARGSNVTFAGRQGLLRSTYDHFLVDGEDYTAVLTEIDRKAGHVAAGVEQTDRSDLPVQQVLCLLGGNVSGSAATKVRTCHLATLPQVVRLMRAGPRTLQPAEIARVGLALGERFRRPRRQ